MNEHIIKNALDYFFEISKIPRGSGNEKAASDYLTAFGKGLGCETFQDESYNVLIRKQGSKGRENEQPVILQTHIDIVCEKNKETDHDFLKDPILPIIEDGWIKAPGTTLGADNGGGLAITMAILSAEDLSLPPIEALFTVNEEVGMTGATDFDASLLLGRRIINLDSGDEDVITVSCASSADVDISVKTESQPLPKGFAAYEMTVKGLTGGHSGVDIDKGRANANFLMGCLLRALEGFELYLNKIDGGAKRNAIPRECSAVFSCKEDDLSAIRSIAAQTEAAFKTEYPEDTDLIITINDTAPVQSVMTSETLQTVKNVILNSPNGILAMSDHIEGLVESSCSLGVVVTDDAAVTLLYFPRSSSSSGQAETIKKLTSLADSPGVEIKIENEKPPWEYREVSPLRDMAIKVFREMYGKEPSIAAIHAGLECGIFAQKMPDADIIAFGPEIIDAHSPDEKMSLHSFDRLCDFLIRLLATRL